MPFLWLTKQEHRALQQLVFEAFARDDVPGYLVGFQGMLLRRFGLDRGEVEHAHERERRNQYFRDLIERNRRGEAIELPPLRPSIFE